ncbi:hypothetical protein FOLKNPGA_01749 [Legionella sp. PC1000]|uniref:DUF6471 domain-containing protein n=1 Tax=Legionella sp. PC1000 TaxID=2746060 RepID=UPI0015FC46D8|nr:DUF6471 domain-containing protein [Legionella sp. PC1000]QLZ68969.1 hypothetical protein FOLKNPGA_01749 [Legionella sp. PC1000]
MDSLANVVDWNKLASSILKAELKRRDISYEKLISLLQKIGVQETHSSILNKMSRGSFQFSFFLQCAAAIGIKNVRLEDLISEFD